MGTQLQRRLFTADEFHRMAQAGVLREDDRVELVAGDLLNERVEIFSLLVDDIVGR